MGGQCKYVSRHHLACQESNLGNGYCFWHDSDVDKSNMDFMQNAHTFMLTLYYSVVTFTTLGYGDITPFGISRLFAAFEAFIGSFTITLFVVVFVKRMTR